MSTWTATAHDSQQGLQACLQRCHASSSNRSNSNNSSSSSLQQQQQSRSSPAAVCNNSSRTSKSSPAATVRHPNHLSCCSRQRQWRECARFAGQSELGLCAFFPAEPDRVLRRDCCAYRSGFRCLQRDLWSRRFDSVCLDGAGTGEALCILSQGWPTRAPPYRSMFH